MRPREALEQRIQCTEEKQFHLSFKVSMSSKIKYPRSPDIKKQILDTIPTADSRPKVCPPVVYTEQQAARVRRFITQEKFRK